MGGDSESTFVIGVDVGGTNTDGVLLDLAKKGTSSVVSANKSPTTVDVTDGIESTLTNLLLNPASFQVDGSVTTTPIDRKSISALTIGTTHFINAIVQRKATLLSRVAVIRLGSHGFVDSPLPFADWPPSLRKIIEGYSAVVPGGVNIDGKLIAGIDEHLLRQQARTIYEAGLRHVVIVGTGSPMDQTYDQEAEAKRFILSEMVALDAKYAEGVEFVLSHMVAGPGLLMRENASILNAAILTFARRTIHSIILATRKVGLACPVYFTSNAGHLLPYNEAMDFPVNIFSSGATNSMRGAAFLAQDAISTSSAQSSVVVIDVGGTTSDAGALLPNGYPRLSSIFNSLAGVKVNLQMPSVESIGLGGGSIIRADESRGLAVGPDSVGHAITTEALCCGGKTPTATDVAILSSPKPSVSISIGDSSLVNLPPDFITASRSRIKQMLESLVDRIKLSPEDCTVILVGGGAFICPSELEGVGKIILPKHAGVANAIGAALAKIHGSSEAIVDSDDIQEGISKVMDAAIQNAVSKGAIQDEVIVLNETIEWVPYVEKKQKVHIDVACDADHARVYSEMIESTKEIDYDIGNTDDHEAANTAQVNIDVSQTIEDDEKVDLSAYRPEVSSSGHWTISPIDLKFLEIGCYILGCGGGGSPHATYLGLLELLRLGEQIVLIDPESLSDDASLPPIAAIGTPAVGLERISSDAVWHAIERLERELGVKTTHMLAIEIGGMNGLATLRWAAKRYCHVPVVDGDLMGRAYPNFEMVSQYVHADNIDALLPVAICSGDGRESIIPKGQKDETSAGMEIRKVCTEYGFAAGAAGNALSGGEFRRVGIPHTFSLAWRLGRVVRRAQVESTLASVTDALIAEVGGPTSARALFTGQVVIKKLSADEAERGLKNDYEGDWEEIKIPFMNENLAVIAKGINGEEKALATIPDLIFLLDISTGEAVGVQEYRYGIKVVVMVMAPHPVWTSRRGIEIAGPQVFHLPYEYSPSLVYSEPRSVIAQFAKE